MKPPAEQNLAELESHNTGQRSYYAQRKPVRMDVTDTPYVRLHFAQAIAAIALQSTDTVLEVGAGLGRFTKQFATRGQAVTAVELSPVLAADCRVTLAEWPHVKVLTADLLDAPRLTGQQFDVVAGFFMLHHLTCLERHFAAVRQLLKPGGRCVFVEPNPWNPFYAVQVTFTPGMRWQHEAGIYRMWAATLRNALTAAGLADVRIQHYGFFPRWLHNHCEPSGINPWLAKFTPPWVRPFQVVSARVPGSK